jgi:hypothetical protein
MAKKPGGRPNTKDMDKGAKFAFLAGQRVSKVLAQLRNLKRLANTRNYTFNQKHADNIRAALTDAVDMTNDAFDNALKGNVNVAETTSFDVNAPAPKA